MRWLIVAVMVLGIAGSANAIGPNATTQELLLTCKAGNRFIETENGDWEEIAKASECVSYLSGVINTIHYYDYAMTMLDVRTAAGALPACPLGTVSPYQVSQAFLNYAKAHPEQWQEPPIGTILDAIQDLRECR